MPKLCVSMLAATVLLFSPALAQDDAQKIRAVLEAQQSAWNQGDLEAFMEGYWADDRLRFAGGNTVQQGFQATLERYRRNYDSRAKMGTLSFTDVDIDVLSDDAAVVFGRFNLKRPEVGDATGLFTLVFRMKDGAWVIVHDHTSS